MIENPIIETKSHKTIIPLNIYLFFIKYIIENQKQLNTPVPIEEVIIYASKFTKALSPNIACVDTEEVKFILDFKKCISKTNTISTIILS